MNLIEILNEITKMILSRDHRTEIPLESNEFKQLTSQLSICEFKDIMKNCDSCSRKIQRSRSLFQVRIKLYEIKSTRKTPELLSCFLLLASIVYIMSSNQAEANPISVSNSGSSTDEVDNINFLNLQCMSSDKTLAVVPLSDKDLRERLVAVLRSCHTALYQTKHLTQDYIEQIWGQGVTVNSHHSTWKHKSISWLWPDNEPLKIHFRGNIEQKHHEHLKQTDWTREKIFDYLGKIYQRFQRIGVGVQIVNKWNELAAGDGGKTLLTPKQVGISTKLFRNATGGIHEVLCQIQGVFFDMAIDPRTDLDITPFVMDEFIKLNHWLVYREYENLMDYSHKLLKIVTESKH